MSGKENNSQENEPKPVDLGQQTAKRKRSLKYQAILQLVVTLALLVALNAISSKVFTRIDFTKEKRYTLSDESKALAKKLDDIVYVKVHLDGELNPDFERLQKATKEMLDEFRVASGGNIEYEFADPLEGKTGKEKQEIIRQLQESGLEPTEIYENAENKTSARLIVPGATFYYKTNQFYAMNLLQRQMGQQAQQVLNKSIESLEYEIISILRKIVSSEVKTVAFLEGHGELTAKEVADISAELGKTYRVERFNLGMDTANTAFIKQFEAGLPNVTPENAGYWLNDTLRKALKSYSAIIIAKPVYTFTSREKYFIDQYVMEGGKLVWLIDPLVASLDTIALYMKEGYEMVTTADYDLNLTDLLFTYGARVNPDLIQDAECNKIPLGQQLYPWVYDPVVVSKSNHIIVNHLNPVWFRFASSIDTVGNTGIKKTILLTSSTYSRVVSNPAELSFKTAVRPPAPALLNKPDRPVAVLLEGKFTSFFKDMRREQFDPGMKFVPQSPQNAMIVISDGDLVRNNIRQSGEILPLGFDFYTRKVYDNKKFMLNCVDYLLNENTLITVRSKEFEIRLLNSQKVKKEETFWKTLNMALPVALIIIFGLINSFIRRRKYVR